MTFSENVINLNSMALFSGFKYCMGIRYYVTSVLVAIQHDLHVLYKTGTHLFLQYYDNDVIMYSMVTYFSIITTYNNQNDTALPMVKMEIRIKIINEYLKNPSLNSSKKAMQSHFPT